MKFEKKSYDYTICTSFQYKGHYHDQWFKTCLTTCEKNYVSLSQQLRLQVKGNEWGWYQKKGYIANSSRNKWIDSIDWWYFNTKLEFK